jgi:hypothetical protein
MKREDIKYLQKPSRDAQYHKIRNTLISLAVHVHLDIKSSAESLNFHALPFTAWGVAQLPCTIYII